MLIREAVAGVDISDGGIAAACVVPRRGGGLDVTHAGYADIAGDATDAEVAAIVRSVWRQAAIPTYTVASCLNTGSLLLQYFHYQDLSEEETRSALRLEAEESLQVPAKDLLFDWHGRLIGNGAAGRPPARDGVLVAAPRAAVDQHRSILAAAGLYPVVLDVGALAVCNLWLHLSNGLQPDEVVFAINLTRHSAHLVILAGDRRVYPRTIVCGSGDWGTSIDHLVDNITGQEDYAETKLGLPAVRRILMTGSIPGGSAFIAKVQERVAHPVEGWTPLAGEQVAVSRRASRLKTDPDLARRMTVSLGLALRGFDDDGV
jgi:Tfp pilus assembly PilM family ATPase